MDENVTENTPFDFVWLGLLIGVCTMGDEMGQLLDQLEHMGMTTTKTRLQGEEQWRIEQQELRMFGKPEPDIRLPDEHNRLKGNFESVDIARWVAEELRETPFYAPSRSRIDIHNSTDLINSLRPGVWTHIPQDAQKDFIDAEKHIHNGTLRSAALLLGTCFEMTLNHFYECVLPEGDKKISWSEKEKALSGLGVRDLTPAIEWARYVRQYHRNPTVHEGKEPDKYEIIEMWQLYVLTASRFARVLERRSSLPGSP
jgi:hypothetical protein